MKAVFLDLGGTLLDPESDRRAHLEAWQAFGEINDLASPAEELLARYNTLYEEHVANLGTRWRAGDEIVRQIVAQILGEEGQTLGTERWELYWSIHWREHLRLLRMFPGTREILEDLHRTSLHLGLISDVDEDFLQICLYVFPLDDFMDSITTSEEVGVAKPHADIFRRALSKAGCLPSEAIHVGDSPGRDVLGANGVGMKSILIADEGDDRSADFVVPSISVAYQVISRLRGEAVS